MKHHPWMTVQNNIAWKGMVTGGMKQEIAYRRMSDWAAMLEERMAELDPDYASRQWGLNFHSPFGFEESK